MALDTARRLDASAAEVYGHSSLGDATWRALAAPSADALTLVAHEQDEAVALVNVDRSDTFAAMAETAAQSRARAPSFRAAMAERMTTY